MNELNPRKAKALTALIAARSVEDAADTCDVPRSTLYNWLHSDRAFIDAYRAARREVVSHAVTHAQQAAGQAVERLVALMNDESQRGAVRIAAAKAVIELAVKGVEVEDILARLEALEQIAEGVPAT